MHLQNTILKAHCPKACLCLCAKARVRQHNLQNVAIVGEQNRAGEIYLRSCDRDRVEPDLSFVFKKEVEASLSG